MVDLTDLAGVLPDDTIATWPHVAQVRPAGSVLMGGTALAVHLRHRVSHDLDLFCHDGLDVEETVSALAERGPFVQTPPLGDGRTLNGVFNETKVQFLAVDQQQINEPEMVDGIPVGSLDDVFASELKVIGDRGELRDYYDLMCIEHAGLPVDYGLSLYQQRYGVASNHHSIDHIVRSLGYLEDVSDDPLLSDSAGPDVREQVVAYWKSRQPEILATFDTGGATMDTHAALVDAALRTRQAPLQNEVCGRIVRSTGMACKLRPRHSGHCRSR